MNTLRGSNKKTKRNIRNALLRAAALLAAVLFAVCSAACTGGGRGTTTAVPADDPTDDGREATGEFSITAVNGGSVSNSGNVWTVSSADEYIVTGRLADGQIVVKAGSGDEVKLTLDNASVSYSRGPAILIINADKVTVKSESGSYNVLRDTRASVSDDEEYDAALWSDCDLKLTGKGELTVISSAACGVKTKDDLTVRNVTLTVSALKAALKGNDSVTVESGTLDLTSLGGDGVKTSNSSVSGKGNQKGTVTISGGTVDIRAACDGISAAYDVSISQMSANCTVNIYTASYASQSGQAAATELYLVVPSAYYAKSNAYWLFFYNENDEDGVWVKCEFDTMIYGGRRESYYGLKADIPSGYTSVLVNILPSGTEPDGTNYTSASAGETVNTAMNGYLISSVEGGVITGDFVNISSGSGTDKTTYSSKGIKAENDITISGGTVTVYAMDDGIHANSGEKLDNGSLSTGCVTISGGTLTVTSADDGIHSDAELTVSGGTVVIAEAHEGMEGNVVTISGGTVRINATDDGINAPKGGSKPLVSITGGYLEITTPSGDTDAIDSNGSFTMSGGFALIKGGAAMGGMAGSVDVDGSITVTGGTIIALGGICETPTNDSVCTFISGGTSFGKGSYTVTDAAGNTLFAFELAEAYSSCWIASDEFSVGGSYTIAAGGAEVVSWEQTSQSVGSAGSGRPGPGRPW